MGELFDGQLHTRLADLADVDPTPVGPSLFATIRDRATVQRRRRRGAALVVAAAMVLVGLEGGVLVRAAVLRPGPIAVAPVGVNPPLSWPIRGNLAPSTDATVVAAAAAAWDRQSGTGAHRQVRLLLAMDYQTQHVRVVTGATPDGRTRIAVLVSPPRETTGADQSPQSLEVGLDVPAPSTEPKAIVVTLAGLGSPVAGGSARRYDDGLIIAVASPSAGRVTVRWAPQTTSSPGVTSPVLLEIDPSKGYQLRPTSTADTTAMLAPGPQLDSAFSLTTADKAGQPVGLYRIEPGDGQVPALPVGIPQTALLVPQRPAVSVPSPTR